MCLDLLTTAGARDAGAYAVRERAGNSLAAAGSDNKNTSKAGNIDRLAGLTAKIGVAGWPFNPITHDRVLK